MAEYALSYTGERVNQLLGLVDTKSFAANDVIVVSEDEPTSETCLVWIQPANDDDIFDVWIRI